MTEPIKLTDAEQKDLQKRVEDCNKELQGILTKYELQIGAEPLIFEGRIVARPTIMDAKKREQPKVEEKPKKK